MMIVLKPLFGGGLLGKNKDPEHKRRQTSSRSSESVRSQVEKNKITVLHLIMWSWGLQVSVILLLADVAQCLKVY